MPANMPSREELEHTLETLGVEAAAVASTLRAAKRRAAAVQQRWILPPAVRRAAVAAYIAAEYATEPAVAYLTAYGRQRHWPAIDAADLNDIVHDLVLATSDDEIAQLATLEGLPDLGSFASAFSYVREWRTVLHVRRLNSERGIAPSTAQLLAHAAIADVDLPAEARPRALGPASLSQARRWAHRLRQRWRGRLGRTRVQETVPLDEKRNKVSRVAFTLSMGVVFVARCAIEKCARFGLTRCSHPMLPRRQS